MNRDALSKREILLALVTVVLAVWVIGWAT
jgi:hypothetical protein